MAFWIFKTLSYVVETYVVHGEVRTILLFNDHQFKRLIRGRSHFTHDCLALEWGYVVFRT